MEELAGTGCTLHLGEESRSVTRHKSNRKLDNKVSYKQYISVIWGRGVLISQYILDSRGISAVFQDLFVSLALCKRDGVGTSQR